MAEPAAAAEVRDEILATFARARVETLSEPDRLERIKDRMRYGFLAGLDNSPEIGAALARYVQYERSVETINEAYASYARVTPADLSAAANRHFTDAVRTIGVIATGDALAGLESGGPSVDALVAAATAGGEAEFRLVERHSDASPLVDVAFVFRAGAVLDPDGKKGLAQPDRDDADGRRLDRAQYRPGQRRAVPDGGRLRCQGRQGNGEPHGHRAP
jgi:zinc protease